MCPDDTFPKVFDKCQTSPVLKDLASFLIDEFKGESGSGVNAPVEVLPALAVEVLVDSAESSAFKDLSSEVIIETEPIFICAIHENHLTPCGRPFLYCTYIIP